MVARQTDKPSPSWGTSWVHEWWQDRQTFTITRYHLSAWMMANCLFEWIKCPILSNVLDLNCGKGCQKGFILVIVLACYRWSNFGVREDFASAFWLQYGISWNTYYRQVYELEKIFTINIQRYISHVLYNQWPKLIKLHYLCNCL